jgi:hypothetical protein
MVDKMSVQLEKIIFVSTTPTTAINDSIQKNNNLP